MNTREEWGRVSVVGCSPTTWLQPRAPQELKVELSVQDASVPPTGVKTIRIYRARPPDGPVPAMAHGPPSPGRPPASRLNPPVLVVHHEINSKIHHASSLHLHPRAATAAARDAARRKQPEASPRHWLRRAPAPVDEAPPAEDRASARSHALTIEMGAPEARPPTAPESWL